MPAATPRVALVTDSTSALDPAQVAAAGIDVVPLQVVIDGQSRDDDAAATDAVVAALRSRRPVTTSRPSPQRFLAAFQAAAAQGSPGIVCVTLSAQMSATYESALLAAPESPVPVQVVDSATLGMGLGFAALAGAAAAARGAGLAEVAAAVAQRAATTTMLFYVDTLEHLRRGGRIGSTRALVGQAMQVKPILQLANGQVELREKVRTAGRAIQRLEELAAEAAGSGPVEIAIQELDAAARADVLRTALATRLPGARIVRGPAGAVVAAHVGPGTVAVVVAPAEPGPDPALGPAAASARG